MGMTDRNTISLVIESLFEDWIEKYKNKHPLAVENMRLLEADALALLKEQEPKKVEWRLGRAHCPECGELFPRKKEIQYIRYCSYCGQALKWE